MKKVNSKHIDNTITVLYNKMYAIILLLVTFSFRKKLLKPCLRNCMASRQNDFL